MGDFSTKSHIYALVTESKIYCRRKGEALTLPAIASPISCSVTCTSSHSFPFFSAEVHFPHDSLYAGHLLLFHCPHDKLKVIDMLQVRACKALNSRVLLMRHISTYTPQYSLQCLAIAEYTKLHSITCVICFGPTFYTAYYSTMFWIRNVHHSANNCQLCKNTKLWDCFHPFSMNVQELYDVKTP